MSTLEPFHRRTRNSEDPQEKNQFERIQTAVFRLGLGTVIVFSLASLRQSTRRQENTAVDVVLLFAAWGMIFLVGLGLWCLLRQWSGVNKLPPTPEYDSPSLGAGRLDAERISWSRKARSYSQKRGQWVVAASLLSPLAVLFLSSAILLAPEGSGSARIFLIVAEIAVIIFALYTVHVRWPAGKAHETWVPARLRTEILRRELFLYRARIGPYLDCDYRDDRAEERIHEITVPKHENAKEELNRLIKLLDMEHASREDSSPVSSEYWRDRLEDDARQQAGRVDPEAFQSDLEPNLAQNYLRERLRAQKDGYFCIKKEWHERRDICWEIMSGLTLWMACAMAILHLGLMFVTPEASSVPSTSWRLGVERWVDVSALTLPPLGALFITLRTYFEDHRLSRSYEDQFQQLGRLEKQFEGIGSAGDRDRELRLKRLILRTETLLSQEVRRWWHIVGPEAPKGA